MVHGNDPATRHEVGDIIYYERETITVDGKTFRRLAVQTHFIQIGESYVDVMGKYIKPLFIDGDILSIGAKIISMCQNNTVDKSDVKLGFWAKNLSKLATKTSAGIGMNEPYKLQLAINIAGLGRVLWATFCGAIGRIFGKRGIFYKVVGHGIAGIDGFYDHSSFDIYKDMALLNPNDPRGVCNDIENAHGIRCMLLDANDINVEMFGKSKGLDNFNDDYLLSLMKDNPSGQGDELTPLIIIREKQEVFDEDEIKKEQTILHLNKKDSVLPNKAIGQV